MSETQRDPCPHRIIEDAGTSFAMGVGGSSIYNYILGARKSEIGRRKRGGFQSVRMNAPAQAGKFAVWGGLFSTFDCTIYGLA
ncbi:Mitochondrial import inner membrane translocase subunit tim17 [Thalictrum thalictroides]|uniref:Mitochondrial import inner membrane translocase subunit tim17 n=1 Tax=Thalictrum thalictroides TaxID=46969 RepID=A0A7J6VIS4_THATH|nr:Mitochondrial import inner membrane translocase subunit tim17 [Thalictrum thalictroides]